MHVGDDKALWTTALAGEDSLAVAALDRFCMILGSVAGDIALAQGASAVVIAGGLGLRLVERAAALRFRRPVYRQGPFRAHDVVHPRQGDHLSPSWPVRGCRGLCRGTLSMNDVDAIMVLGSCHPSAGH